MCIRDRYDPDDTSENECPPGDAHDRDPVAPATWVPTTNGTTTPKAIRPTLVNERTDRFNMMHLQTGKVFQPNGLQGERPQKHVPLTIVARCSSASEVCILEP